MITPSSLRARFLLKVAKIGEPECTILDLGMDEIQKNEVDIVWYLSVQNVRRRIKERSL